MSSNNGALQIPGSKLISDSHVQEMSSSSSSKTTKTTTSRKASASSVTTVKKTTSRTSTRDGPSIQESSTTTAIKSSTHGGTAAIEKGSSTLANITTSTIEEGALSFKDDLSLAALESSILENPASFFGDSSLTSFKGGSTVTTVKKSTHEGPGTFMQSTVTTKKSTRHSGPSSVVEQSTFTTEKSSTHEGLASLQDDSTIAQVVSSTHESPAAIKEDSSLTEMKTSVQEETAARKEDFTAPKSLTETGINFSQEDSTLNVKTASAITATNDATATRSSTISTKTEEATTMEPGLSVEVPITVTKPATYPGATPFDMTASVKSPSGVTEVCDVKALDDSHYSIKFVPREMGVHTVSVKHKDMHIPGSPFEFTVGPIAGGGSHKVHAAGPGLERGEVDVPNEFNIYTREAGAGGLSIAVEGPSKAEIEFQDKKDGSCNVAYRVSEPGEYYVSVKFNDEHIPDSPFRVNVTPSIGDARKLSIQSMQDRGLEVGKPAAFVVNFNGAKGRLYAKVVSPSGAEEEALIQEVDDGQYAVRFIPRENGVHHVHVLFDNYDIPGSPFKVVVGKVDADAGKVTAYGEGLKSGRTGQVAKFIVNTVNAGSGSLAVTVEGPSKVKLECKEVDEGYEFSYRPTAPGDYLICIRYAGVNIAGSPFKAKIEGQGQPSAMQEHASVVVETVTKTSTTTQFRGIQRFQSDASKVTAKGAGLTKAFKGKTATFTVDASKAGNNIMYVGMMGPKGPCEELIVKHQGNLQYNVQYMVRDSGRYMLIVRWGEQDIPGSPFAVEVQ
ncbi:filamin-c [Plakobranchus ocellatus]|uniref:Filamin-c n=1 Tax=Plakobranchus ocellatus TaxID=259542 RepID=A0AAV3ZDP5_9GAST|nr:filamin-c [Plakobranchus ocellatus]